MSKVVKKVFKPIGKIWKGAKNAVSKVWDKVKKPLMIAAAVYLTAGVGMAAYGAATGAASGLAGSLSYGFGTVNSFLGFGASQAATGAAGKAAGTQAATATTSTAATSTTQAVTAESLKAQLATGLQQGTSGISFKSGLGVAKGGSVVSSSAATQAGAQTLNAAASTGVTGANVGNSIAYSSKLGGSAVMNSGAAATQTLSNKIGTEQIAQGLQQTAKKGVIDANVGNSIAYSSKAGGSVVNGMQPPSFLENLSRAGSNIMDGEFSKAGGNLMDAGGQVVDGIGNLYDAATATTGRSLLTSNLLTAGGNYLSQRDAEKEAERARMRRTWYGMNGYGETADFDFAPVAAPRLKPQTVDDLIRMSQGG